MRERLLAAERIRPIEWEQGRLCLLDQRQLPQRETWLRFDEVDELVAALGEGVVRGSALQAIAAAYGVVLAAATHLAGGGDWRQAVLADMARLAALDPASASLGWALQRMRERVARLAADAPLDELLDEARAIHRSDREANLTMAQSGAELIRRHGQGAQRLFAQGEFGALAGGGFGTALGVVRAAQQDGLLERVYLGEGRPRSMGARLGAWELAAEGLPVSLCADAAAGHLMKSENLSWIVVGAERIAANGDLLAPLGTYGLAVLAMHHGVRFMVVAPASSIDLSLETGEDVVVEQSAGEAQALRAAHGLPESPSLEMYAPAYDVTPADLIDVIVTERGVVERPDAARLSSLVSRKRLH